MASTWQGTALEHMHVGVAMKHRFTKDGFLYHACNNAGGVHLIDGESATWTWSPGNPKPEVEDWLGFDDLVALEDFAKTCKAPSLDAVEAKEEANEDEIEAKETEEVRNLFEKNASRRR